MSNKVFGYYNNNSIPLEQLTSTDYSDIILGFAVPTATGSDLVISGNLTADLLAQVPTLKAAGKKVMLSLGGAYFDDGIDTTEAWNRLSQNVPHVVEQLVAYAETYDLDGIDIDFENNAGFDGSTYNGVDFLCDLTEQLHAALPENRRMIAHAPQSPYFDPAWNGGPYRQIMNRVGDKIADVLIQYYNQGEWYTDPVDRCVTGLGTDPQPWSVAALVDAGVAQPTQIGVGALIGPNDGGYGYLPADQLAEQIVTPLVKKYGAEYGGTMGWQVSSDPDGSWAKTMADA